MEKKAENSVLLPPDDVPVPRIVVSRCLEFDACRWNGQMISDHYVRKLRSFAEFIPVCPEVEIGLGVPRDPVRMVRIGTQRRLFQPATERDLTLDMTRFSDRYLDSLTDIDGFILKGRSPSCGIKDTKVYAGPGKDESAVEISSGLFGTAVLMKFPYYAVEDEGRLNNFTIREHFLTLVFTFARFRQTKRRGTLRDLVRFHTDNKFIFMANNQEQLRILGNIVANHARRPLRDVLEQYEQNLHRVFLSYPRAGTHVNVLMHAMGYFSGVLNHREKGHFIKCLDDYRAGRLPLSACLMVVRSWIEREGDPYLSRQTYFDPYPRELVEITDSGKGRSL